MASSTILVIDDDTIVRESIVAYLEDSGFEILQAENGEMGLAVFRETPPDIILCDLRMPKMDGLAVLRSVRELSPDTPFIVVSGAGVMADVVEALRLGASDYIIKPIVDLEVLEYAINRALENAQLTLENRRYRESLEEAIHSLENNLHLLQEDQKAGRQVQMKMLPQEPLSFEHFKVDHQIIPSLYLSGDFVDYFALNEHSFAFYLADVSGHGASSAFVTVLLKHMSMNLLREYQSHGGRVRVKPSHVLNFLNRSLLETGLGKHVAVFGGVVDTRDQKLTYAFGGHYPLPILSTPEETRCIEGRGLPVGLFEDATFEDVTIDLPEQFTLTILSDGILEVLPQQTLQEKEDYLLSVIKEGAVTVSALTEKLGLKTIKAAPDDVAMLILARN
ncbi:SpoIIE family protein phosphatase [Endozoicomonas arenosclerae]|uniref:SpoIIE family protein phosphatase n=1 Tax=Endozoicomonas arenosclerae TaxID=1633495 RepID=UPI000785F1D2|nr:SpoIIE family protein phosphatase [Endozoicomonas arenosclerae]